ncbi:restriction endonuclease subunit S [Sulfuritalea sp.]|uniref:restriction endonuclease subunit S n=1 Tax=Sulfuritalea sp. TaxID=2480090 RepID=UPI00286D9DF3|nr:restriction endonuclease subunit S [Sulfuritalea sp.]
MEVREPSAKYLAKPAYKQTEVGLIPEDWDVGPLSRVAEIRGGIAKNSNVEASDPISVHYLRVANVQDGFLDLSEMSKIQLSRHDLKRYTVLPGDVLMNEGGDLDKLGRGAIWHGEFNPCVHQNHVFVVRCKPALLPDYLNAWTATSSARRFFLLAGKQTTNLASISKSSLAELPVAVPPIPEQRAIAAVLSDVDALLDGLERLIAKKRGLKQAAMQQLLTGQTRLPGFSDKWELKRLGDVADALKGSGLSKGRLTLSGARPCLLYGELFTTYTRVIRTVVSRTDSCDGCTSVSGDVLLPGSTTTSGMDLATASALLKDGVALGGDINVIRRRGNDYDPEFLANYLTSVMRKQIAELTQGITIHHLYGRNLKALTLKLPSLPEQTAIAAVLSDMDAELSALVARRDKTRDLKQAMMQELLTGRIRLV